jgi:ATP-dependent Clp protease ATP-binding subunit ClpA
VNLSPQATQVIDLAIEEARKQKQLYVGTEYLLLGLIRLADPLNTSILENLGVSTETLRLQTLQTIAKIKASTQASPPNRLPIGKFTERARKVLALAQEESQRFRHNYIGTEHLLLALIRENGGIAGRALRTLGIELESVRKDMEAALKRGDHIVLGEIGLTAGAKKTIELAVDEARHLKHHYIGTEHILLGLIHEGTGIGNEILARKGATLEKVRTLTIQFLSQPETPSEQPEPAQEAPPSSDSSGEVKKSWEETHLNKLNEQVHKVLVLAKEEALRFQHNYIGTEHLLLGLTRDQDGIAAQVLARLGVGLDQVRRAIEFIIGRGDRVIPDKIGMTPRSKQVIELAIDEAQCLNQPLASTEHLLLGLVREGRGIAAGVLESMGINLARVRQQTLELLPQGKDENAAAFSSPSSMLPAIEAFTTTYHLTDAAKKVLDLAQREAHLLHHDRIGPEHLLAGLLHEEQNAAAILFSFSIDLAQTRAAIENRMGRGQHVEPGNLDFTPLAWAYLYMAADEAQQRSHHQLDTPHLLLALIRENQGAIPQLLESLGTTVEAVRAKALETLQ